MTVYHTGDIHAFNSCMRLGSRYFDATGLTCADIVMIAGDFGLVWYDEQVTTPREDMKRRAELHEMALDWLNNKPFTTVFVDGNHENHDALAQYPVVEWNGGKAHQLRENVFHLMRGEVYVIDGESYLCMGGAVSVDKDMRVEGESWWANEIPSDEERQNLIDTCEEWGWTFDYVITHDCPINITNELGMRQNFTPMVDEYENWLQFIADKLTFTRWIFGHYHGDFMSLGIGGKFTCLYEYIVEIDDEGQAIPSERMLTPTMFGRFDWSDKLPESEHGMGYTVRELCEYTGAGEDDVELAISRTMWGSACTRNDAGEFVFYPSDVYSRILPAIG